MLKARLIIGLTLSLVGATLLLSPAGTALGSFALSAVDDPLKPTPGPGEPSPNIPTLTSDEQQEARSILQGDPRARPFLEGRGFSLEGAGVWTTLSHEKIGALLVLNLDRPAAYPLLDWPTPMDAAAGASSARYRSGTVRASAKGVTTLLAHVDLADRAVAGLRPGPGPDLRVTPAPGTEITPSND